MTEPVEEQDAVGKPGEGVVQSQALGLLLGRFPLGDVQEYRYPGGDTTCCIPDRCRIDDNDTSGPITALELDFLADDGLAPGYRTGERAIGAKQREL
jgi:hypothetical protein